VAKVAIVLAVCAVLVALVWMFKGSSVSAGVVSNSTVVAGVAAVIAILLALVQLWPRGGGRSERGPMTGVTDEQAKAATNYLAEETLKCWRGQAHDRRLTTPEAVAVRWQWGNEDVAVPPDDLGYVALTVPETSPAEAASESFVGIPITGVVTTLKDQLYRVCSHPGRVGFTVASSRQGP
jgi:hypothetical protein